mmetsp:Transcript_12675/g.15553  ORF Transcript_12675/g.15553 Transcript_12675/m.15553 type:complete len:120 (+) Transcript_12675:304-663(+)
MTVFTVRTRNKCIDYMYAKRDAYQESVFKESKTAKLSASANETFDLPVPILTEGFIQSSDDTATSIDDTAAIMVQDSIPSITSVPIFTISSQSPQGRSIIQRFSTVPTKLQPMTETKAI